MFMYMDNAIMIFSPLTRHTYFSSYKATMGSGLPDQCVTF